MLFNLKTLRQESGLSQVKLAHESGVSLPTIQNIEAGKANPTIEVLEKLGQALGFELQFLSSSFDPDRAAAFGVPISGGKKIKLEINKNSLKTEARLWLRNLLEKKFSEREEFSIAAFLKAIHDHYPSYYRKEISNPTFDSFIEKYRSDGRVIKLRRIALANVSGYL